MLTRLVLLFSLTILIFGPINAQTTAPARDPQALTVIASSLKALTGSTPVNDVILQANASISMPFYRTAVLRAREAVLADHLIEAVSPQQSVFSERAEG